MPVIPELAHLAEHPELALSITTGTEHFSVGQTTLTVHGSGAVEIDNRRAGSHQRYTGQLSPSETAVFGGEMASLGLVTLSSDRTTYEMGEMTVTIEVRSGDRVIVHTDLPADERFFNDRVARLVGAYEGLVGRFTDGALPYGRPVTG